MLLLLHLFSLLHLSKGNSPSEINNDICAINCASGMSRSVQELLGAPTNKILSSEFFEKAKLDQFCRNYLNGSDCIAACPSSTPKRMMQTSFKSLEFMCKDRYNDVVKYLPCYQKSEEAIRVHCDPICGKGNIKDMQKSQSSLRPRENAAELSLVLGRMCSLVDCEIQCQTPLIGQICGSEEPAEFLREFSRASTIPLQTMMEENRVGEYWPSTCAKLTHSQSSSASTASVPSRFFHYLLSAFSSFFLSQFH